MRGKVPEELSSYCLLRMEREGAWLNPSIASRFPRERTELPVGRWFRIPALDIFRHGSTGSGAA
jgi:hypothetical protein